MSFKKNAVVERLLFMTLFVCTLNVYSQPQETDTWYQINDGFAKCTDIGESGGYAQWYRDDFEIHELIHKEGQMYAYISYGVNALDTGCSTHAQNNPAGCSSGFFRHNMVEDKWTRVANLFPTGYGNYFFRTNGSDILGFPRNGDIYILDEDESDGWRKLTNFPVMEDDIYRLTGNASNEFSWNGAIYDLIGDTLFILAVHDENDDGTSGDGFTNADMVAEQGIIKYNYRAGTWSFDSIGEFPGQNLYNMNECGSGTGQCWDGDHHHYYKFADHVAGRFVLFTIYRNAIDKDSCWNETSRRGEYNTVKALYTYDPIKKKWYNISEGPDWRNLTPSDCTVEGARFYTSWDKKKIFISIQQGIYEWGGDNWEYKAVGGSYNVGPVLPTYDPNDPFNYVTFYTYSRGGVDLIDYANRIQLGPETQPQDCKFEAISDLSTPDNGNTLYFYLNGQKYDDVCDWSNCSNTHDGVWWLEVDEDKVSAVINLHLEAGTYIGGDNGENQAIGVGVGGHHQVFTAGNFASNTQGRAIAGGYVENVFNGANASDEAQVIGLNTFGDTIYSKTVLGGTMTDYDMQNYGNFCQVACGDFGVSVLDSSGKNLLWTVDHSSMSFGTDQSFCKCDIDDNGNVVVMKNRTEFNGNLGEALFDAMIYVFDKDGALVDDFFFGLTDMSDSISGSNIHVQDVTIKGDTVFLTGFVQDKMYTYGNCDGGGMDVQSGFIRAYEVPVGDALGEQLWQTFGFDGNKLSLDQADTRGYRINIGKDGKLYFAGEAAGGNSVFRWDGNHCICCNGDTNTAPDNKLVTTDLYNTPYNTGPAHIAYFCTVDPASGEVKRGYDILPRLSSGKSNSFRLKDGAIHADQKGFVYVGGRSSASIAGRDMMHINGSLLGDYNGGDMSILIVQPDYQVRTFWGAFNKNDSATGNIIGFGIRDNIIAAFGNTTRGTLFTGASRYDTAIEETVFNPAWAMNPDPFNLGGLNSGSNTVSDSWLGVWYQDVWNHAHKDTLEPREYPSQPVFPDSCMDNRADFMADQLEVCIGEPVVFNDYSIGDSCCWVWSFGDGADHLPGTTGEGPFAVTYSTPGYKTVKLTMTDSCGNNQSIQKLDYIRVWADTVALDSISGPSEVCEGATATFKTDYLYRVNSYNWNVPSGAIIVSGNGTNVIEVIFGNASGDVSVSVDYSCGTTAEVSKAVNVVTASTYEALLVVDDDSPLSSPDIALRDELIGQGYNPWIRTDDEVVSEDHQCVNTVVLSGTVEPEEVEYKFRDVNTSVITLNDEMFYYMGMTNGNESDDYGTEIGQNVDVTNTTHELGQGLATGSVQVYSSVGSDTVKYAINCGTTSGSYTASDGVSYGPDNYYTIQGGGDRVETTGNAIDNTTDDQLYQTVRSIETGYYSFPVDSGLYEITVRLATIDGGSGDRIQMYVEDDEKLSNYSISSLYGYDYAKDFTYTVNVSDGELRVGNVRYANDRWEVGAIKVTQIATPRINWGDITGSAITVANIIGNSNKKVSIGYDVGTQLYGSAQDSIIAPDRRVGIFLDRLGPDYWTADGLQLFRNAMCWANYSCPTTNAIQINSIAETQPFCSGQPIHVNFTSTGTYNADNRYIVQLSTAFGSFTAAQNIGEIAIGSDVTNQEMTARIPDDVLGSTGYKIRVISTSPTTTTGISNPIDVAIIGTPEDPTSIEGKEFVCKYISEASYTVEAPASVTNFMWEIPLGAHYVYPTGYYNESFVRGTDSIRVEFGTATSNPIKVWSISNCDTSDNYARLDVSIVEYPPKSPYYISGKDTVCQNYRGNYSLQFADPPDDAEKFGWDIPADITINGSDTSQYIDLYFIGTSDDTEYTIRGWAVGACGNSDTVSKVIRVDESEAKPVLGPITESDGICVGEYIYSVTPVQGGYFYDWLLPPNATGSSTTNQITVTYTSPSSGNIGVAVTDSCGTSDTVYLPVNITNDTTNLDIYLGPDMSICGQNMLHAGDGYESYQWNTGETTQSIVIADSGTYWVVVTDIYGCFTTDSINVDAYNPERPTAHDTTVEIGACGTGMATLTASGSTERYKWYDQSFGGSALDSMPTFFVQNLSNDTTFYVSAWQFGNPNKSVSLYRSSSGSFTSDMYDCRATSGSEFTAEAWVRADASNDPGDARNIFTYGVNRGPGIYTNSSGVPYFHIYGSDGSHYNVTASSDIVSDKDWHHVAGVFEEGVMRIYVDGNLEGTNDISGTITTYKTDNGRDWKIRNWHGWVDEFRMWSVVRTQTELQEYMYECLTGREIGLNVYLNFNDSTVSNLGGNSCTISKDAGAAYDLESPLMKCDVCESGRDTLNLQLNTVPLEPFYTRDYIICDTSDITVTAWGGSGQFKWYDEPVGGNLIDSVNPYLDFTALDHDTSVYVSSWEWGEYIAGKAIFGDYAADNVMMKISGQSGCPGGIGDCECAMSRYGASFTMEMLFKTSKLTPSILVGHQKDNLEIGIGSMGADEGYMSAQLSLYDGSTSPTHVIYDRNNKVYVTDDQWHHVAFSFNSGVMRLYVDGVMVDSTDQSGAGFTQYDYESGNRVRIAGETGIKFKGYVDEFRLWSDERTIDEINDNKDRCITGEEEGLEVYASFDGENPTTAAIENKAVNSTLCDSINIVDINRLSSDGEGAFIACGTCESDRDTVSVTFSPNELAADDLDSATYCPGDPIKVPFAVCESDSISTGVRLEKAFAFGETSYTTSVYNEPSENYIKVEQDGANFTYSGAQGHGYTETDDIDGTSNNRNSSACGEELYDQFIGTSGGDIIYQVDVPNGDYKFVAAMGDAKYSHNQSLDVRDGSTGTTVNLINNVDTDADEYAIVEFDDKVVPPCPGATFTSSPSSPTLTVTNGYIDIIQSTSGGGGDLVLFEIWSYGDPGDTSRYFYAELSDVTGDFSSATILPDTVTYNVIDLTNTLQGEINTWLPSTIAAGTGYEVRPVFYKESGYTSIGTESPTTITISTDPTIATQPSNQTICENADVTFSVAAINDLGYQWYYAGTELTGEINSSLTITGATRMANGGRYWVDVIGKCTNVRSDTVVLDFYDEPVINTQPVAFDTACLDSLYTFSVSATGYALPVSYQWRKDGTEISGATAASYPIFPAAYADSGNYDVIVSDNCGQEVVSDVGELKVEQCVIPCPDSIITDTSITDVTCFAWK